MQEQPFEGLVLDWHVGHQKGIPCDQGNGGIADLPVKKMSKMDLELAALVVKIVQQLRVVHDEPFFQEGRTDREQLDGLDKVIREIPVESFCDVETFGHRLFREGYLQIGKDHGSPVTDHRVEQEGDAIGDPVEQPHRQKREQIEHTINKIIHSLN